MLDEWLGSQARELDVLRLSPVECGFFHLETFFRGQSVSEKSKSRNRSILLHNSPSFRKSWSDGKITEIIPLSVTAKYPLRSVYYYNKNMCNTIL